MTGVSMKMSDIALCVVCVCAVSLGQVLLRAASVSAAERGGFPLGWLSGVTVVALIVYAGAMLLWLYVLSRVPLAVAFPFFGLCFLLVPLLGIWLLHEPVGLRVWLGGMLILTGITVSIAR